MAEGRMLKRNISISKRLPQLKTDSARMLWTWIIPFLDVEGRYYASPDLVKSNVVPRVKTFNEENISEYLQDMAKVGLITLYEVDNEAYLQYRKFEEFQSLRKDHEGKPLPAPPKSSGPTTDQLQTNYRPTTAEVKLSKVKLSKGNAREEHLPVDNSKSEDSKPEDPKPAPLEKEEKPKTTIPQAMENGNGGSMELFTLELQKTLSEVYQTFPDFNIHRQVQLFLELNLKIGPRKVILHALRSILKAKEGIITARTVSKYLSTTFTCEHAKYNARDHEREAEQWKQPLTPAARAIMDQLGLGGFGGGNG